MFYVYVLESKKDGMMYAGYTPDLKKRLLKHNLGKVFSTRNRRPVQCIYTEICIDKKDAVMREKYLKSGVGKRFIKQRLYYYFHKKAENT